jgi:predicted 2-oxoglutarate/Fe(II)-dependent dioxygenase YbiX
MHAELKDYIKIEKSFLDAETCKSVIASLKDVNWNEHQFYEASTNEYNNKSVKQYQDDLNYKWFSSWSGYSQIRFNRYTNNKKMAMHCDHITDLFDGQNKGIPTLSLLGILNDDYQGGEFIMFDNLQLDLQAGDLLIFPSNFMYPHRVEPVTNGERYSFISWMW